MGNKKDYTPHFQSLVAATLRGTEGVLEQLTDISQLEVAALIRLLALEERYGRHSAELSNIINTIYVKYLQLKVSVKRQGRKELVRLVEKSKDKSINQFLFRRKTAVEGEEVFDENP